MSIEDKPSGYLILGAGNDSEKDGAMQGFVKCRTAKVRSLEFIGYH